VYVVVTEGDSEAEPEVSPAVLNSALVQRTELEPLVDHVSVVLSPSVILVGDPLKVSPTGGFGITVTDPESEPGEAGSGSSGVPVKPVQLIEYVVFTRGATFKEPTWPLTVALKYECVGFEEPLQLMPKTPALPDADHPMVAWSPSSIDVGFMVIVAVTLSPPGEAATVTSAVSTK